MVVVYLTAIGILCGGSILDSYRHTVVVVVYLTAIGILLWW